MPAQHAPGLDQEQRPVPSGQPALEQDPKESIGRPELEFGVGAAHHHELMTQGEVFQNELAPG
jgi:hypothetical protein